MRTDTAGVQVPWDALFPIPMRGNEGQAEVLVQLVLGAFPIPMRGNELIFGGFAAAIGPVFPIPMRGNELSGAADRAAVARFPIPMRGNEKVDTYPVAGSSPVCFRSP